MPDHQPPRSAARPPVVAEPEKGTRLSALEIHDNVLAEASADAERRASSLLWSALASGAVIGFSFLASGYLHTLPAAESHKRALAAAGYPLGFILVVIGRFALFTEKTLTPVLPLLHERTARRARELLRVWGVLLAGNLAGALAFGWLAARTPMVHGTMHEGLRAVAEAGTRGGFGLVFYQAIFAGWLIAGMAWLLGATTARGAQIALVWLSTAPIAAFGFRHSIAGAVEAFYRAAAGHAGWGEMLGGFVVPAVLGNALGGAVLVAVLNYAQVRGQLPPHAHTRGSR